VLVLDANYFLVFIEIDRGIYMRKTVLDGSDIGTEKKNHYFRCFVIFLFRIDWGIESHIFVMFLSYSSSDTGSFGRFETINPLDSDTKQA
jgi:hypothetical protein